MSRYSDAAQDYQRESYAILKLSIDEQKAWIDKLYSKQAKELDAAGTREESEAIERFERFIKRYPRNKKYTPDAMSYSRNSTTSAQRSPTVMPSMIMITSACSTSAGRSQKSRARPTEHADSIKVYKRPSRVWDSDCYTDAVLYLLGYVLEEAMDDEGPRRHGPGWSASS